MSEPIPPELAGAWRLVELQERASEDAPWEPPLGEDARGVFFCDLAGVLSAHIHAPNAPDPARRALAYFGFFTVRGVERTAESVRGELIYELDGGYWDEVLEPGGPHPFDVTGDTLVLGDQRTSRRTLTRIR
jgi:hypothetical protein